MYSFVKYCFIYLYFVFFVVQSVHGQIENPKFYVYNTINNLSHNSVEKIFQDSYGYLWVGTIDGLNKFDGYNFTNYKNQLNDSNSLIGNRVYDIFEDTRRNLWIATGDGLSQYDKIHDNFINYSFNILENYSIHQVIFSINQYNDSILFIATTHGLIGFNINQKTFWDYNLTDKKIKKGTPSFYFSIYDILKDKDGNYWFGTAIGLFFLNSQTKNIKHYQADNEPNGLTNSNCQTLLEDSQGHIWIGTYNGLNVFNKITERFKHLKANNQLANSIPGNHITNIAEDKIGNLWICTRSGLGIYKEGKISKITYNKEILNGLPSNELITVFVDAFGIVWLGGERTGVCKYSPLQNYFYHLKTIFNDKKHYLFIHSIQQKNDSLIYIALNNSVYEYNKFQNKIKNQYSFKNIVNSLYFDNNILWINAENKLFTLKNNQLKELKNKKLTYKINQITASSPNELWLATTKGLVYFNHKTDSITCFSMPYISYSNVQTLSIDKKKETIWIGSRGGGVDVFNLNTKKTKNYKPKANDSTSLSSIMITCIYHDIYDNVWIGTKTGGVCKYNPENDNFTRITVKDGLCSNMIRSIIRDDQNNIWLATNRGISKYNTLNNQFDNFDVVDGLQDNEFNHNAVLKDTDGQLYFGGINGVTIFSPQKIQKNTYPPIVDITSFKIQNKIITPGANSILKKHISETSQIKLKHTQNHFSFEFTALHFERPDKNIFRYQMKGLDTNWFETNAKYPYAVYSGIPPGNYIFTVKAANYAGIWNDKGKSIKINIPPPFWATWYFRTFFAVFIITSISWGVFKRLNNVTKQKNAVELKNTQLIEQKRKMETQTKNLQETTQNLQKAYSDQQLLSEFGQRVTATLDLNRLLIDIYDYVSDLVPVSRFSIAIYQDLNRTLHLNSYKKGNDEKEFHEIFIENTNSISAWCFRNQKPVINNQFDIDYKKYIKTFDYQDEIPLSVIYLPLLVKERKIGVISVQADYRNAYSKNDLYKLQLLASYISIALDNANNYKIIQNQNKYNKTSLRYAKNIQDAFIGLSNNIFNDLETFVIFKPKRIVSGDFYWYHSTIENNQQVHYIAVADCTGHGIPGAFLSLIGYNFIDEIVKHQHITQPATILEKLNLAFIDALNLRQSESTDGIEVVLCKIIKNETDFKIIYAGAKRNLVYSNKQKLHIQKATRKSIGGFTISLDLPFKQHELILAQDEMLYLFSDGIVDQKGKENGKMGTLNFISFLTKIQNQTTNEQKKQIEKKLKDHQQGLEQIDDITIIGVRLKK